MKAAKKKRVCCYCCCCCSWWKNENSSFTTHHSIPFLLFAFAHFIRKTWLLILIFFLLLPFEFNSRLVLYLEKKMYKKVYLKLFMFLFLKVVCVCIEQFLSHIKKINDNDEDVMVCNGWESSNSRKIDKVNA